MDDKIKLLLFSVICAIAAWSFWYITGKNGFYIVGLFVVAAYVERIYKHITQKRPQ